MSVSSDSKRQRAGWPTFKRSAGAVLTLALCLSLFGCSGYNTSLPGARCPTSQRRPYQIANNPNLIFDSPSYASQYGPAVSSEQFGRQPWPSAPDETSYISSATVIAYEIDVYDDQYIGSNNRAYQNFHHRLRGKRVGMTIR